MAAKKPQQLAKKRTQTLAKLARPRTHAATLRERLFGELDAVGKFPVIWISGPPGSGKTTLAASYLNARGLDGIWYQLDRGDNDISGLFHYLALAAQKFIRRNSSGLPARPSSLDADPILYARGFFRQFFGLLPTPSIVVFDNYQEIAERGLFHEVIGAAIEELPEQINLIVISRQVAPAELSRALANGHIAEIGWDALKLTAEETMVIARARHSVDDAILHRYHELCGGWAAGLTLMLEQQGASSTHAVAGNGQSMQRVFNYFAGQFFDSALPETQQTLMQTAFLPLMTATMAERISANQSAGKLLASLHDRHLFVERVAVGEFSYQYHDLFRAFLLARAREIFTPVGLQRLQRHAAALLEESSCFDHAIALYVESRDWDQACRVIKAHAEDTFQAARWQTLQWWITQLPTDRIEQDPWLLYWLSMAKLLQQPNVLLDEWSKAWHLFERQGEQIGQVRTAAAVMWGWALNAYAETPQLDQWMHRLAALLQSDFKFVDTIASLDAHGAMLYLLHYRQPQHPFLPECLRRVVQLVQDSSIPMARKSFGAGICINYCFDIDDDKTIRMALEPLRPILQQDRPQQFSDCYGWHHFLLWCIGTGDLETARRYNSRQFEFARVYGMQRYALTGAWFEIVFSNLADRPARDDFFTEPAAESASRPLEVVLACNFAICHAMRLGDYEMALLKCREWLEVTQRCRVVFLSIIGLLVTATIHAERRQARAALEALSRFHQLAEGAGLRQHCREAWLIEAHVRNAMGDGGAARELLLRALQDRRPLLWNLLLTPNQVLTEVCALALESGIAVQNARELIMRFGLRPPRPDISGWPWAVAVRTLGGFQININGEPLEAGPKAQRKPLDLLKALIARGGRNVNISRLAEDVWFDLDGDAALVAFHSTLHRLRKLLRADSILILHEGKLSLNAASCWTDVAAVEHLLQETGNVVGDTSSIVTLAARLNALYAGQFLRDEADAPWTIVARGSLHGRYVQQVLRLGAALESRNEWMHALELYELAIDRDNVSESLYRALMACHQRLGRTADALQAYRRCCQMLSIALGTVPSRETEAIHQSIRAMS
jgi:LuxR family transcriptional regulator, maltose regulon positive regulatory protein